MKKETENPTEANPVNSERRELLKAAGAGVLAAAFSGVTMASSKHDGAGALRWGVVGTGGIANSMAPNPGGDAFFKKRGNIQHLPSVSGAFAWRG